MFPITSYDVFLNPKSNFAIPSIALVFDEKMSGSCKILINETSGMKIMVELIGGTGIIRHYELKIPNRGKLYLIGA